MFTDAQMMLPWLYMNLNDAAWRSKAQCCIIIRTRMIKVIIRKCQMTLPILDNYIYRSSPLRPFPRVLLCPLSIPKVTIVHGVGCSLNLNISYYCSSVSWEYRQRLVEYGQAIDPQNLPLSGHPLLQKARTFGLGTPRPPPWISITNFNIRCHLT